ncbi:hypothetical protein HYV88_03510 [Candidatus Woesearchaeota archaeon]|nr:hypothetical protein [Candidatus Woesearchaeota archaeon]
MYNQYGYKPIQTPKLSNKLAELVGIILGDGCIMAYPKNSIYSLTIAGNSKKDYYYLKEHVSSLLKELFDLVPYFYLQKDRAGIQLTVRGKMLITYLVKIGLKPGNKVKNNITIPGWILENKSYVQACIRGLIDTDGSVYFCGDGSLFTKINFCSGIEKLRKDFRNALIKLGYHPTPWNKKNLMIYRKNDVIKYYKEIGFKNLRNLTKFKAPVV